VRRLQREPMPSSVLSRDGVPAKVFHRHARLATYGLEVNVHLSRLMEFEAGLPPAEDQARRPLPDANASNLEYFAIGQPLDEPTAWPRLEGQPSRAPRRELKQPVRQPPLSNVLGEQVESPLGRGGNAQGHKNAGAHARSLAEKPRAWI
jgi:hypothetical protein